MGGETPRTYAIFTLCLVASLVLGTVLESPAPFTKKDVLRSLDAIASTAAITPGKSVAVGYNANLDVIVDALALFEHVGIGFPEGATRDHESIGSEASLAECFGHFFATSSAAERTLSDAALYDRLVEGSLAIEHTERLGGNAALMGLSLSELGFDVTLGGQAGERVAAHLGQGLLRTVGAPAGDAPFGKVKLDEVHLILEYPAGASFGPHVAGRANRFIVSHDVSNAALASFEALDEAVSGGSHDLLVVTGFHLMESLEEGFRKERLGAVSARLRAVPASTAMHLELASMGDPALVTLVAAEVLSTVDSLGLNEQELASLFVALGGAFKAAPPAPAPLAAGAGKPARVLFKAKAALAAAKAKARRLAEKLGLAERLGLAAAEGAEEDPAALPFTEAEATGSVPPPAAVALMLEHVLREAPAAAAAAAAEGGPGGRVLSRIHFHCYGYHVVAQLPAHPRGGARAWPAAEAAAAAGSVRATVKACGAPVGELHGNSLELKLLSFEAVAGSGEYEKITDERPVATWTSAAAPPGEAAPRHPIAFSLAPVLVCKAPLVTVGLGDAISAAALARQLA